VPLQTLNDYLSFATHPLQIRAFNHIMSSMTTKSVIYGIINLRISFNEVENEDCEDDDLAINMSL